MLGNRRERDFYFELILFNLKIFYNEKLNNTWSRNISVISYFILWKKISDYIQTI